MVERSPQWWRSKLMGACYWTIFSQSIIQDNLLSSGVRFQYFVLRFDFGPALWKTVVFGSVSPNQTAVLDRDVGLVSVLFCFSALGVPLTIGATTVYKLGDQPMASASLYWGSGGKRPIHWCIILVIYQSGGAVDRGPAYRWFLICTGCRLSHTGNDSCWLI